VYVGVGYAFHPPAEAVRVCNCVGVPLIAGVVVLIGAPAMITVVVEVAALDEAESVAVTTISTVLATSADCKV